MKSPLELNSFVRSAAFLACLLFSFSVQSQTICETRNGGDGYDGTGSISNWTIETSASSGSLIGASTNNGDGDSNADGDITSATHGWGLWATDLTYARQHADIEGIFLPGDQIKIEMDNGDVDQNATVGFGIGGNGDYDIFGFFYTGGDANYSYRIVNDTYPTNIPVTDEGVEITITFVSPTQVDFSILDIASSTTESFNLPDFGWINNPFINRINLYNFSGGSGSTNEVFFNNLEICRNVVDGDSDGWLSHLDCDDSNPNINPGETETLYNGIDDDCDPETPDFNSGITESSIEINGVDHYLSTQSAHPDSVLLWLGDFYCDDQIIFDGAEVNTFKCEDYYDADIEGASIFHRVYSSGSGSVAPFTETPLTLISNDGDLNGCSNQTWGVDGLNIDLLDNPDFGAMIFEYYTTATYTYTDGSGTHEMKQSGQHPYSAIIFYLEDDILPQVECSDFELEIDATGTGILTPEDLLVSASDNCEIDNMVLSQTDFDCSNLPTLPYRSNDLLISEYIQTAGQSFENYVEIYNGTYDAIDLSNYELRLYKAEEYSNIPFPDLVVADNLGVGGFIQPGEALVFCYATANLYGGDKIITANYATLNNGNYSLQLFKLTSNQQIDLIGSLKEDPEMGYWEVDGNATRGQCLRRLPEIHEGISDSHLGFPTLGTEWESFASNDYSNLGQHSVDLGTAPSYGIVLSAIDENGNEGHCTSEVTFSFAPPALNCASPTIYLDASGNATISENDIDENILGGCGIASNSLSETEFDCDDLGENIVTLSVTDIYNNTSTCDAIVTIADNIPPTAVCQNISIQLDISGNASITPAAIDGGSTDNCEIATIAASQLIFDESNAGANTVTLTVTDNGGNTSTCDATVTVLGDVSPEAHCVDIAIYLDESGMASIDPSELDNGSTSPLGIAAIAASQTNFSCADFGDNTVTLTVTDTQGNSSTCEATVTVGDINPPNAICQDVTVNMGLDGLATLSIEDVNNGSTDNCAISTMTLSQTEFACGDIPTVVPAGELIISEYVHGSIVNGGGVFIVNNYIEVYNGTPFPIDFANYELRRYDYHPNVQAIVDPLGEAGIIESGATFVFSQLYGTTYEGPQLELPDFTMIYNGSMAMELFNVTTGQRVDLIGEINVAPEGGWLVNGNGTWHQTLRRKPHITQGVTQDLPGFPSLGTEWDSFPLDDMSNLGMHESQADLNPTYGVLLTVYDEIGNSSTCASEVSFSYSEPEVSCADFTLYLDETGNALLEPADLDNGSVTGCGIEQMTVSQSAFDCNDIGEHTITFSVADVFENISSCNAVVTVVDNIPPTAICQDLTLEIGESGTASITVDQINNGSFDNCGIASMSIDQENFNCNDIGANSVLLTVTDVNGLINTCTATVTITNASGTSITAPDDVVLNTAIGTCTAPNIGLEQPVADDNCAVTITSDAPTVFPLGITTVTWTATNGSGNPITDTQLVTVIDNISPTITAPSAATYPAEIGLCGLSNNGLATATGLDNCSAVSISNDAPSVLPIGLTIITWTGTDASGNTGTATQLITILDNEAPSISAPADLNLTADAGLCTFMSSSFDPAIAADNCGTVSVFSDAPLFFTVGTTTVTWTATDASGNTNTAEQTVIVMDAENPAIVAPADITLEATYGLCAFENTGLASATASDNCGNTTVTNDAPASFPIGITTVIWTATDDAGNTSSDSQTVTVLDSEDPTLTVPTPISVDADAGTCSAANVLLGDAVATDNCGTITISNDAPSVFPVGETLVLWTATDASGNTTQTYQTVTVLDAEAPTVLCQDVTIQLDETGMATLSPSDMDGGSYDNCGIATMSLSQYTFDCSDIGSASVFAADLFISEYVEGTSNNKYIEVYNGTGVDVDLAGYALKIYNNGASSPNTTSSLSVAGILASGEVAVFRNSSANVYTGTTYIISATGFNGDDAIVLFNGNTMIDIFGEIGDDPGSYWSANGISTANQSLRRNANIIAGNTANLSGFPTLGTEWSASATDDVSDLGQHTSDAGAEVSEGGIEVVLTMTDNAGNTASCTANVTIEDNLPPAVACQDMTVYLDENGMATIEAADIDGSISDNCGIANYALSQNTFGCADIAMEASGDQTWINEFHYDNASGDVGEFIEVTSNMDASVFEIHLYNGNGGSVYNNYTLGTATSSADGYNYYVLSLPTNGIQNGPDGIALSDENGNLIEFISYGGTFSGNGGPADGATSTDVGITESAAQIGQSLQRIGNGGQAASFAWAGPADDSPGAINVGQTIGAGIANTVDLTVTDVNGNTTTCTTQITVIDNIAPVAICQNTSIALDENGVASISIGDIDNGSFDNCSLAVIEIDVESFDCTNLGVNDVTLTVTDMQGLTASCTAQVTITDNIAPMAICQDIEILLDANGLATISPSEIDNGSTDNCGIAEMTLSRTDFSCADLPSEAPEVGDQVWINEMHYDNNSTDQNEGVEVVANFDISGYSLIAYNGSNGQSYSTASIQSGDMVSSDSGYDFYVISLGAIQNGGPDGIALMDDGGSVVQFLSYEGTFTATNGPASGAMSTDIGVSESGTSSPSHSLQLTGSGQIADDFTWTGSATSTFGAANNDQSFGAGNQSIEVVLTVTDNAGNESTCSANVTIADDVEPQVLCQDITVSLDANGHALVTAGDIDAGSYDNCTSGLGSSTISKGSFDCNSLGENTVTLTITDASGNTSTCESTVTIVDDTPPIAVCQDITVVLDETGFGWITEADVDNGSSDNCRIASMELNIYRFDCSQVGPNNPVILTVTDNSGNISTCTAQVNVVENIAPTMLCQPATVVLDAFGQASIVVADIDNGSFDNCSMASLSLSNTLFDCTHVGENTVTLTGLDSNGNMASCTATVTVVDNIAPEIICVPATVSLDQNGITTIDAGTVILGITENCDIASITVSQTSFDCSNIGTNVVTVTATDVNGNMATCQSILTVIDDTAPQAICQNIEIALSANGTATITPEDFDNGSSDNCGLSNITLDQYDFDCSHIGDNLITLTVMDNHGNESTCMANVHVADETAPVASCQNIDLVLDASGNATISLEDIDNGSSDNCGIASMSLSQTSFDCSHIGINAVVLTVFDESGNSSTCTASISIGDNIAPVVNCQDISIQLDALGMATILPDDITSGYFDNCGAVSLAINNNTFDCSDIGANSVTLTATDSNGNQSTCTATVTVADVMAPVALCQNMEIALNESGVAMITSSDIDAGSTDNCEIASITASNTAFDCSNIGSNTVTLIVTDANGNTATCDAIVTVVDIIAPVALCQNATIMLDANGEASIANSDINNGSSDNCGLASVSLSQYDFDCNAIGINTVTMTVTDANGNSTTCEAQVTVVDNMSPAAICQSIEIALDENGLANITSNDIDNGSSDNCGIAEITLSQYAFDCADIGPNSVVMTVTDVNGNSTSCATIVNIIDTTAPMVTCQDVALFINNTGSSIVTAAHITSSATDNCGTPTLEITSGRTVFDCSDEGTSFLLEVTATDASGNQSVCTALVTIIEGIDSDGDGVSNACDICIGDDSTGDSDGDGICDSNDTCPGSEGLINPDAACDASVNLSGGFGINLSDGLIHCVNGPFNGGSINVTNGTTVRLSGSGNLSVDVQNGATLEVMDGSDIILENINLNWGTNAMVVHAGAEIAYDGTFSPNATVINCGTISVKKLKINYDKLVVNNGTIEITHSKSQSTVSGNLVNNGYIHSAGSFKSDWNGLIENHCHIEIDRNLEVQHFLENYAFINVGLQTKMPWNGRIKQYDGAMFRTESTRMQGGRYVGYGDQSFVKVLDITEITWGGGLQGSLAFCDENGIESQAQTNVFYNGAVEDCMVLVEIDECNPIGHIPELSIDAVTNNEQTGSNNTLDQPSQGNLSSNSYIKQENTEIKIWPNPTNGNATISFTPIEDGRMNIELYAIEGTRLMTIYEGDAFKNTPHTETLEMRHFENGVYIIRFIQNGKTQTKKLVLTH